MSKWKRIVWPQQLRRQTLQEPQNSAVVSLLSITLMYITLIVKRRWHNVTSVRTRDRSAVQYIYISQSPVVKCSGIKYINILSAISIQNRQLHKTDGFIQNSLLREYT